MNKGKEQNRTEKSESTRPRGCCCCCSGGGKPKKTSHPNKPPVVVGPLFLSFCFPSPAPQALFLLSSPPSIYRPTQAPRPHDDPPSLHYLHTSCVPFPFLCSSVPNLLHHTRSMLHTILHVPSFLHPPPAPLPVSTPEAPMTHAPPSSNHTPSPPGGGSREKAHVNGVVGQARLRQRLVHQALQVCGWEGRMEEKGGKERERGELMMDAPTEKPTARLTG